MVNGGWNLKGIIIGGAVGFVTGGAIGACAAGVPGAIGGAVAGSVAGATVGTNFDKIKKRWASDHPGIRTI